MSYDNPWTYNGEIFDTDNIQDHYGYVYCIENLLTGRKYLGRKYFWQKRKEKGKRRRVTKESDWKKYYGSSDELKADVKEFGKENFKRTIISLHKTPGKVNFHETKSLFEHEVLSRRLPNGEFMYYNSNILSRYFRKDYSDENT